jgi:signal transduction histidine kinase
MPPESPARASIETNLRQARELIEEVRTRVGDLRNQEQPRAGLADLLQEFNDAFPERSGASFQISVVGATRALDPLAFEEVLLIGREAISNAIRHAEATHITVELTYTAKELALKVSDDGKGIESSTLETGRQGHWGLQGMRERARALGAVLEVWSRPGAGTDIELVVPSMIAYDPRRSTDHKTFLQRLLTAIAGRRWPW